MKKLIYLAFAVLLISCESSQDVKDNIDQLKKDRESIRSEIILDDQINDSLKTIKTTLQGECQRLGYIKAGKTPRYFLKLRLKQSHFSLSITKHIKDHLNAIDIVIPVDYEYYNSVQEGQQIVNEFRTASLFLSGSIGDWEVTVIDKKISL